MISSYDRDAIRPAVGTLWVWEPEKSPTLIKVTGVRWNGEEWFVECLPLEVPVRLTLSRGIAQRDRVWNDLSRFWEACHYVAAGAGPSKAPGATRRGEPRPDEMASAA